MHPSVGKRDLVPARKGLQARTPTMQRMCLSRHRTQVSMWLLRKHYKITLVKEKINYKMIPTPLRDDLHVLHATLRLGFPPELFKSSGVVFLKGISWKSVK